MEGGRKQVWGGGRKGRQRPWRGSQAGCRQAIASWLRASGPQAGWQVSKPQLQTPQLGPDPGCPLLAPDSSLQSPCPAQHLWARPPAKAAAPPFSSLSKLVLGLWGRPLRVERTGSRGGFLGQGLPPLGLSCQRPAWPR